MNTQVYTHFTRVGGTALLYSCPANDWIEIILRLESAGPVAVGTTEDLAPPTTGKGRLLPLNEDVRFTLPPGGRFFIAASAINRVAVEIQPFPWLAQILLKLFGPRVAAVAAAITPKKGR
jgi:hypothetical protein